MRTFLLASFIIGSIACSATKSTEPSIRPCPSDRVCRDPIDTLRIPFDTAGKPHR